MAQLKKKAILVCEECLSRNYSVSKSSTFSTKRLEVKKYCKTCDKHNLHKETR